MHKILIINVLGTLAKVSGEDMTYACVYIYVYKEMAKKQESMIL